jgi:hypothetical protein
MSPRRLRRKGNGLQGVVRVGNWRVLCVGQRAMIASPPRDQDTENLPVTAAARRLVALSRAGLADPYMVLARIDEAVRTLSEIIRRRREWLKE